MDGLLGLLSGLVLLVIASTDRGDAWVEIRLPGVGVAQPRVERSNVPTPWTPICDRVAFPATTCSGRSGPGPVGPSERSREGSTE